MEQIICDNISIGYDNKSIMENLTFSIKEKDYLCIVGENGAGKSTIMKTILGLLPALKGEIKLAGNFTRKDIGYLPQQTVIQKDFPATVSEVVMSGFQSKCGLRPFYKREEKQKMHKILEKLGISNLQKRCYRELSGGQQQRVLLGRALCGTGKMILLDEPVTGLDALATEEMYELIKGLNDDGITIVMISHDIRSAIKYATHILYLQNDSYFYGTTLEFIKSDLSEKFAGFIGGHN